MLTAPQWYLWGYVLTFSPAPDPTTWTWYGGHAQSMVLYQALVRPVGADGPKIPELLYAFYQGMFAAFTPALVCGGVIKKFKVGRFLIFIWLWSLLVYYPVARWTWGPGGFSEQNDVMDFAGGTAVHITSGTTVGAIVLFHELERHGLKIFSRAWAVISPPSTAQNLVAEDLRDGDELPTMATNGNLASHPTPATGAATGNGAANGHPGLMPSHTATSTTNKPAAPPPAVLSDENAPPLAADAPHSLNNLVLGTMLLWIGWLGFNGGSALGGNMRALSACAATHVAASTGACVMLVLFWLLEWCARKWPRYFHDDRRTPGDTGQGSKLSVVQFCDGAVVGLVAITPAAGYVSLLSELSLGSSKLLTTSCSGPSLERWVYRRHLFWVNIRAEDIVSRLDASRPAVRLLAAHWRRLHRDVPDGLLCEVRDHPNQAQWAPLTGQMQAVCCWV